MEEKKIDLSIIILSYNSKTDLERLLPSVWESEGVDFPNVLQGSALPLEHIRLDSAKQANGLLYTAEVMPFQAKGTPLQGNAGQRSPLWQMFSAEVIVVDNGSKDGTLDWLKAKSYNLKAIANANNGFAHGNNLGIKIAKGKYLLILNPDTKLEKDTLKIMYEFMEAHPEIGISTCKVLLPNGKLDLACRRRFPNPWNSLLRLLRISNSDYNMLDTDENASQEIDSCMGAFMMIRGESLTKTKHPHPSPLPEGGEKGFDEDFFMYGEDLDLCWRVKEAGYKVWYHPTTFITHYKGSSSRKTPFKALKWFHDAMWIFYKKHYAQKYFFVFNWLVWAGIYLRLTVLIIINSFKKDPKVSG